MKLLNGSSLYPPEGGGSEVFAAQLLPLLQPHGIEAMAIAGLEPGGQQRTVVIDGVTVHLLALTSMDLQQPLTVLRKAAEVRALVAAFQPDIVQLNGFSMADWLVWKAARDIGVPMVFVAHGGSDGRPMQVTREMLAAVAHIVGVSEAGLEKCVDENTAVPTSIIRNALADPGLSPLPLPTEPRLVVAGRLAEEKGVDVAIDVVSRLLPTWPSLHLEIIGDGPLVKVLPDLVQRRGLGHAISFSGRLPRSEVYQRVSRSSMLLALSRPAKDFCEAFCLSALEAGQVGRTAVVSDMDGLPTTVLHDRTGIVVPVDDAPAAAAAVDALLRDPERLHRLGAAARQRALTEFDVESHVAAYASLYRQVLERGRTG